MTCTKHVSNMYQCNKWIEDRMRVFRHKDLIGDSLYWQVLDEVKDIVKQAQQDTLEWCLKEVVDLLDRMLREYKKRLRMGTISRDNVRRIETLIILIKERLSEQHQTIKKKMEGGE